MQTDEHSTTFVVLCTINGSWDCGHGTADQVEVSFLYGIRLWHEVQSCSSEKPKKQSRCIVRSRRRVNSQIFIRLNFVWGVQVPTLCLNLKNIPRLGVK